MTSRSAVEPFVVEKPVKTAKPAARKRAPATRKAAPRTPKPPQDVLPVEAVETPRHNLRVIAGFGFVLAVAVTVLLIVNRGDDAPAPDSGAPVAVSAAELASFAAAQNTPVYWAGLLRSRTLELTTTDSGTFVRYLPAGTAVGGSSRSLTIATYPVADAYATAVSRAKGAEMTSSRTAKGGLAVWSKAQPTSVYVAFRGVPSLVEVYAPKAEDARTFALSPQLRPVR